MKIQHSLPIVLALALLVGVAGCATGGTASGADRDLIPRETIQASSATDAYQLIRSVRPGWLHARGAMSLRAGEGGLADVPIRVYIDNNLLGTVEDLPGVSIEGITEIRRLSARDATQRFGTGHPRGAIVISRIP